MLSALYYIIIYPIELLLQVVYSTLYSYRHNAGLSIIGVSIVINLLLLPLYNRADSISKQEQNKQKSLARWADHIKKAFKGDERFMILQAYYRKNGYKPIYSIRSSISLLLQIPFFIAAYYFLSNLSTLKGLSFLWLKDLGQPDQLIVFPTVILNVSTGPIPLAPLVINVLPIIMTMINIISCVIYTKNSSSREKIQLYVMAFLFLILLYNSPSGLVIYWTANNLFSLTKNVVTNLMTRKPNLDDAFNRVPVKKDSTVNWGISYFGGVFLMVLLSGMVIPSTVIVSSPAEFVSTIAYKDPLQYIISSLCISVGFFLLWCTLFYYLASDKVKRIWRAVLWLMCVISMTDFLVFGKNQVNLSSELKFDTEPTYSYGQYAVNTIVLIILVCLCTLAYRLLSKRFISYIYILFIVCFSFQFMINVIGTEKQLSKMAYLKESTPYEGFTLSKSGKNVVVIMLDRAIGPYLPFIFTERPELVNKFSGFTYYPNALTHGNGTYVGSPALFGGYEYCLPEFNKRKNETSIEKQNQALLLMPLIFSEHGYRTTVYDAPLANYNWDGDLSIYDPYPDIHAYRLKEQFTEPSSYESSEKYRKRQFFMYSIYKTLPLICNSYLYNEGWYLYPDTYDSPDMQFNNNYAILKNFIPLTNITDAEENTFMMIDNEITHSPAQLQLPDYTPSVHLNNEKLETGYRTDMAGNSMKIDSQFHYHCNMAAFLQISDWLDYLKENDVYDNTRIIIVSDHGDELGQFDNLILDDGMDAEQLSVLLMYKDFNSTQYSASFDFMTNADCPTLATKNLIEDPINPFTGNPINDDLKKNKETYVCPYPQPGEYIHDTTGQSWYAVHGNIYDKSNWKKVDDPTE